MVGVGIDISRGARFQRALPDPEDSFRDAVFTVAEAGESMRFPARHFAARLAAIVAIGGAAPGEVRE